ncbi:2-oxoacid:acceptor oxidoreductase family protein [Planctomycetota bacterium]
MIDSDRLPHQRSINVALLGLLSRYLDIPEEQWLKAIRNNLPEKLHQMNEKAFALGRKAGTA